MYNKIRKIPSDSKIICEESIIEPFFNSSKNIFFLNKSKIERKEKRREKGRKKERIHSSSTSKLSYYYIQRDYVTNSKRLSLLVELFADLQEKENGKRKRRKREEKRK